jgi:chaperonin GroEL|tara:strand:- start:1550 stop:3127 length:1578 start_codon:yes stop_codon:yes gene_type:complete
MKDYSHTQNLRESLLEGIRIVAENVASTLGPKGRTVILHQKGKNPITTKDGVTVAKFIDLENPIQNTGAQIVKQAAEKTNQEAGDGTTTTTVLTYAMYREAQKYLTAGAPPIELKKGMELAINHLVAEIEAASTPIKSVEDIQSIATIAANGDDVIGKLVAKAVDLAGKDGSVTIEEARSLETSLDLVEGFRFDSGYLATAFINEEQVGCVRYDNPLIMVTDEKIEAVEDMLPALEIAARESRPFVIIAENIEGQALAALIMNAMRGTMRVCGIKAPRYGEERRNILKDLAISIGATLISRETGVKLKDTKLTHFGEVKKIEVTKNFTTMVGGSGDLEEVEKQIEKLKAIMQDTESLNECEKIQERITRLASGVSVIRVGAATEIEMIEKRHRVEDALESVRSAQIEGILPGGGSFLVHHSQTLLDRVKDTIENDWQELGVKIVQQAIREPLRQMCKNAGESPDLIIDQVQLKEINYGYDFNNGAIVDVLHSGIIDPARVTRCALQNAVSVAGTLITSNYAIIEV